MANTYTRLAIASTSGGTTGSVTDYVQSFDATTDWGSASGGYYSISIPSATHKVGANPHIQIEEEFGSDFVIVDVDQVKITGTGDVTIRVTSSNDARFAGRVVLQGDD